MATRTDPATVMNNSSLNTKAGLVFPSDLQSTYQDFMAITAFNYTREAAADKPALTPGGGNGIGSVFLPMPIGGLSDTYKINYKTDALGVIGGFAKDISGSDPQQWMKQVGAAGSRAMNGPGGGDLALIGAQETLSTGLNAGAGFIAKAFTGSTKNAPNLGGLANQITAVGSQALGKSQNPNLSLTFNGVDLKSHQFTWKLVAKNEQESRNITQIMNFFKLHALPTKSSDFALNYPKIFKASFHGQQNPSLILFSTEGMFLVGIDFKYDNEGHPAFFAGTGDPVSVVMTLTFQERIIITGEDVLKI
jgi:hypothetical protein